jgi:hypothetical protein
VVAFAKAHAKELDGPWADLRGIVQVLPGRDTGTAWALRYDGEVFRTSADGTLERFDGLTPPPAPVSCAYPHLRVTATTVAVQYPYGRIGFDHYNADVPNVIYLFDAAKKCWTLLAASDGPIEMGNETDNGNALAARYVAKHYPPLPGGMVRECSSQGYVFHWFEGEILVHVDRKTYRLIDLSAEIGKLAGRDSPAHLYRADRIEIAKPLLMSDCGLWQFDPVEGTVTRVPLGLTDENVMTLFMPENLYGKRADGTMLIGVAPQQGGEIFIVDPATAKVTPTHGYCGLGPVDWFAVRRENWKNQDPQAAVHAQYLAHIAGKKDHP